MGLVLKPAGLAGWREALAELQRRVGELFGRPEPRRQAGLYLEGLLGPAERSIIGSRPQAEGIDRATVSSLPGRPERRTGQRESVCYCFILTSTPPTPRFSLAPLVLEVTFTMTPFGFSRYPIPPPPTRAPAVWAAEYVPRKSSTLASL